MPKLARTHPDAGGTNTTASADISDFRARLDAGDPELEKRLSVQIAALDPAAEQEAMDWLESVYDWHDKDWMPQE